MRRNIAIAQVLAGAEPSSILLIAGAREAALFSLPEGTDTLALPALSKDLTGAYRSRSLGLDIDEIVHLRAHALSAALAAFHPDVLIVDKLPTGVEGELAQSIDLLSAMGTKLVLGLREVLDEPSRVHAEWERAGTMDVLRRRYDAVWVYGDPDVFDPVLEYDIPPDVAQLVRYSGYIDRLAADRTVEHAATRRRELDLPDGHLSVCLVGGGEDGFRLADAFARCRLPDGSYGLIVTGPFMPECEQATLAAIASERADLRVIPFLPDADTLIWQADEVIAMGGYNTTCEILACGRRALIVPRVVPRREQLIRAERLDALGAIDLLHPSALSADALSGWLAAGPRRPDRLLHPIDMNGLRRLPSMLDEILSPPAPAGPGATPEEARRRRRTLSRRAPLAGSVPA